MKARNWWTICAKHDAERNFMLRARMRKNLAILLAIVMAVGALTIMPVAVDTAVSSEYEAYEAAHGLAQELEADSLEFEEISDELARSILTSTLQGAIGMQGFYGYILEQCRNRNFQRAFWDFQRFGHACVSEYGCANCSIARSVCYIPQLGDGRFATRVR
ncbi:MAG: hypothetical protein FWE40_04310 [Oscillospiraceae bacterium]|nr:hypothetical protein [Oscillospiraceae bacterium]